MAMLNLSQFKQTLWIPKDYTKLMDIDAKDAAKILVGVAVVFPVAYATHYFVQLIRHTRKIGEQVDKLPGDPKHWLYGNIHQHPGPVEASLGYHTRLAKQYKTSLRLWLGPFRPSVLCVHPDTIKIILRTAEPKTQGFGGYNFLLPWLGYGLLLGRGQLWARNRRLITPAFHFDVLKPYMDVYNEAGENFIDHCFKTLETNKSVEIFQPVSLCTLSIILRCAFSYEDDVQKRGFSHPFVRCIHDLSSLITTRFFKFHLYFDTLYYLSKEGQYFKQQCDFAHQIAYDIIEKRKQVLETNQQEKTKRYLDFLDILLLARDDNGQGLSDLEIRQEVDTFLFEGHDTVASAISWCLHALAGHPEYQTKAREEIEQILQGRTNSTIQWDDLSEMNYLTMCIKESMRLVPPVPFIGRELTSPLEIDGVQLKTGTYIDIGIWSVHHNEHVWGTDHMEYKPERFLYENTKDMDSYAFIPFSAGPRNCIGQNFAMHEIKVVIAKILMAFELRLDPDHRVEKLPELVMRAKGGIKCIFSPRKTNF